MRWTTGTGIAVGGSIGAVAALLGASGRPGPVPATALAPSAVARASASAPIAAPSVTIAATPPSPSPAVPAELASAKPAPTPPPGLDVPTTRDALLKAMLHCDQRRDFDACARVAVALDSGSAGPADPNQAKRFRRIALTHLVAQCEAASARACLVLAAKYRAGTELTQNVKGAEALEARAAELCRLRPSDCPKP